MTFSMVWEHLLLVLSSLVIAVGCTGGRHRSVSVSRRLCKELRGLGQNVTLRHRDAEKG